MTLGEAYRHAIAALSGNNSDDSHIEARVLLCHLLNLTPEDLYTRYDTPLPEPAFKCFEDLLQRRLNHEPSAYITGQKEFYGIDLQVDPRVLIPRPETELLVEETLAAADRLSAHKSGCITVVDIGTGSGAIAIALAIHRPELEIFAVDRSFQALDVAFSNARRHGVENNLSFLCGNLLEPLEKTADIIAANLPYISDSDFVNLEAEISDYEPAIALSGGVDGLDIIEELLIQVSRKYVMPSTIILEISSTHRQYIIDLILRLLPQATYCFIQDGNGLDRVVKVSIPHSDSILQI